jgi:hypothetical protein
MARSAPHVAAGMGQSLQIEAAMTYSSLARRSPAALMLLLLLQVLTAGIAPVTVTSSASSLVPGLCSSSAAVLLLLPLPLPLLLLLAAPSTALRFSSRLCASRWHSRPTMRSAASPGRAAAAAASAAVGIAVPLVAAPPLLLLLCLRLRRQDGSSCAVCSM